MTAFEPRKLPSIRNLLRLHVGAMLLGVCLIATLAVAGLDSLHQNLGAALDGYDRLRRLYEAGVPALAARDAVARPAPDVGVALRSLDVAMVRLDQDDAETADVRRRLSAAMAALRSATATPGDRLDAVNGVLGSVAQASGNIRTRITAARAAAERSRRRAIVGVALAAVVICVSMVVVGINLFRIVHGPIAAVSAAARRLAGGHWDERVDAPRSAELAALAHDFNRMAAQLADLHRHMETKVIAQSEQLARSHRLASVGYLAAGVAHEINNPLGIIVGYGERSLRRLSTLPDQPNVRQACDAIRIMCDEAFRCRTITDRLLSLSRGEAKLRSAVSLTQVWRDVVADLSANVEFKFCTFVVESQPDDAAEIIADAGQMRQLAINLLTNGAEAGGGSPCRVVARIGRADNSIDIEVTDNGIGMTPGTVAQVFEPFFTTRRGQRPGTGLGLSIANGIVTAHRGAISAHSDGPGLGSRFAVRLPAEELA